MFMGCKHARIIWKQIARLFGSLRHSHFFMTWGSVALLSLFGPQVFYERHDLSWGLSILRHDIQLSLDDVYAYPFKRINGHILRDLH